MGEDVQGFDRREFLRATAGIAAIAWLLPESSAAAYNDADLPPSLLSNWPAGGAPVMAAFAQALLPDAAPEFPTARQAAMERVNGWFLSEPQEIKDRLGIALRVLDFRPVFSARFTRLQNLPVDVRREVLKEQFAASSMTVIRTIYFSLKSLVLYNFFDQPEIWPLMGYDGPWVGRMDAPELTITPPSGGQ